MVAKPVVAKPVVAKPLRVERVGGLAGYGGARARIRSHGQITLESLPTADRRRVESLFESPVNSFASSLRDGFRYRLSRESPAGTQTIEVPEEALPAAVTGCVKDELL